MRGTLSSIDRGCLMTDFSGLVLLLCSFSSETSPSVATGVILKAPALTV